jgi:hypothetical protein
LSDEDLEPDLESDPESDSEPDSEPDSDSGPERRVNWARTRRVVVLLAAVVIVLAAARCGYTPHTSSSKRTEHKPTATKPTATKTAQYPLSVVTTSLPNAVQGVRYSVQLKAEGGVAPYSWRKVSLLPKGLHLVVSPKGLLHGIPSKNAAPGVYAIKVSVHDHSKKPHLTATATLTLHLYAPAL